MTLSFRHLRSATLGALTLFAATAFAAAPSCANVTPATCALVAKMGLGLNIDSPLANDDDSPGSRLSASEITDICRRFKSVRLPFRFSDKDGKTLPRRIAAAKALADQFVACGAVVIVDNHLFKGFEQEAAGGDKDAENQFLDIWTHVAQAFKDDSPNIILELLNEPSENVKATRWNEAAAATLKRIRGAGFQNTVLMGTVNYNGVWTLGQLRVPADRGVIVGVHIYEPMNFTHQGAQWLRNPLPSGVACCDATQQDKFVKLIQRARQWSDEAGVPIVIGEFGVMRKAPPQARLDYVRTFVDTAKEAQVPLLYWEYDRGFGLYDPKAGQWDAAMLDALAGRKS